MILVALLAASQIVALTILVARLYPGRRRIPPVMPDAGAPGQSPDIARVSVVVATLNEAARIGPCIEGLKAQGADVLEVLFVDSDSTDGTRALIERAAQDDPRFRLMSDAPRPDDWVGKVWALETGLRVSRGDWLLGIDADTEPAPGMVRGIVRAMRVHGLDAASFGPRFVGQSASERWLQPAMLMTLIYRTGAAGDATVNPKRVLANGQCFMARREVLLANGGYSSARQSFSDDVTLARHLASNGARVGFLDGSKLISVRAYQSAREMWREWGRSFDLKDGSTIARRWADVAFVWLSMALPVPVLLWAAYHEVVGSPAVRAGARAASNTLPDAADSLLNQTLHTAVHIDVAQLPPSLTALVAANALLLCVRILLLVAIRGSYGERGFTFWLSWLADIPASVRLTMSTAKRPRRWRGRSYE